MEKNVINKIIEKYEEFSKTNKVIADYITKNYLTVSFISIKELSEKINVSPASITRFAKELGLNGYPELQQKLQVLVKNEVMPMKEIRDSISIMDKEYNILESIFNANIESLKVSLTENLIESFSKAVDAVMEARKVYILGLRSSYSPAYYLYFMLKQFMENVILLNTSSWDIYDYLADADERDLLITIGYSRYTALTVEISKYCRTRGIKVVGITDNISSPIAVNSDITLIAKNVSNAFSFVSAMTICNALVVACGAKNKDYSLEKMKKKESILLENKIYE